MFASVLKMITFYLIGNRISEAKNDSIEVRENAANYAEKVVHAVLKRT